MGEDVPVALLFEVSIQNSVHLQNENDQINYGSLCTVMKLT